MYKALFTIGEYPIAYIGYTSGKLWNGWATPYFELDEAKAVAEGYNETAEYPMQYDEVYDQFYILNTETTELETWKGEDYETAEGIKHIYGIGAYSWVWDEETVISAAEAISNLFWDYDMSASLKFLAEKFEDFSKFKKAVCIFRADETAEVKIEKLRRELK